MRLHLIAEQQNGTDIIVEIYHKIDELSRPDVASKLVEKMGPEKIAQDFEKIKAAYRRAKQQHPDVKVESVLSDIGHGAMTAISSAWDFLTNLGIKTTKIIGKSVLKMFAGLTMPTAQPLMKVTYVGTMVLAAGLSGFLLSAGASAGMVAIPWGLLWFGHNFIEPLTRHGSQQLSGGY